MDRKRTSAWHLSEVQAGRIEGDTIIGHSGIPADNRKQFFFF